MLLLLLLYLCTCAGAAALPDLLPNLPVLSERWCMSPALHWYEPPAVDATAQRRGDHTDVTRLAAIEGEPPQFPATTQDWLQKESKTRKDDG